MSITPKQIAALTDRHKIVVKYLYAPEHIQPVELELWIDNDGDLRDSLGFTVRWSDGIPAVSSYDIIEIIEPPLEFKYGDVIGHPEDDIKRAVYLPSDKDDSSWLTRNGWVGHDWALARLEEGWVLNPDRQEAP